MSKFIIVFYGTEGVLVKCIGLVAQQIFFSAYGKTCDVFRDMTTIEQSSS